MLIKLVDNENNKISGFECYEYSMNRIYDLSREDFVNLLSNMAGNFVEFDVFGSYSETRPYVSLIRITTSKGKKDLICVSDNVDIYVTNETGKTIDKL